MVAVWSNRSAPLWRGRLERFSADQRAGTIYVTFQKRNWGIWLIWWSLVHSLPALIYPVSKWKGSIQYHAKWTSQTDCITLKTANSADVWSLGSRLKFNRAICFRLALMPRCVIPGFFRKTINTNISCSNMWHNEIKGWYVSYFWSFSL